MTDLLNKGEEYWKEYGFVQGMRHVTTDAFASIAKFWWNSTEFPVEGNFMNHALDHTICFTFNPGQKLVEVVTNYTNNKNTGKFELYENLCVGLKIN